MKPTKTFKMSKKYKVLLTNYAKNKELRNHMKKLFIQAQLIEESTERVVFK